MKLYAALKNIVWLGVISTCLVACSTKPFVTQAQIKHQAVFGQLNSAIAYAKECDSNIASNPDVVFSYEQITLKGMNPPNRAELLGVDKKLSSKQKVAYQNYLKLDNECTAGVIAKLDGSPFLTLFQGADALVAINDSNLLNEKVTIGEGNAKKLEIMQKFYSDLSALQQQLNSQFLQAHNTEITVESNKQAVSGVAAQNAINQMNTATQIRQSQTTQQLLQQNQYRPSPACIGFNCR